jgi:ribonuclease I
MDFSTGKATKQERPAGSYNPFHGYVLWLLLLPAICERDHNWHVQRAQNPNSRQMSIFG